jgi:pyridoxamine 5'-phosphate oxidase
MSCFINFPDMEIDKLRTEYRKSALDISSIDRNPNVQFEQWFNEALKAGVPEPNAMSLATVAEGNRPAARIVLLKGIENGKFLFYTNYQSQKGKELEKNPACALVFFWPELERQVRITGVAERVDAKTSETYFQSRPRASQIGAWASPQSAVLYDRSLLDKRVAEIEKRFEGKTVLPKPQQWGGFGVEPLEIEFWQGRPSRLHDRLLFTKVDGVWTVNRLAP